MVEDREISVETEIDRDGETVVVRVVGYNPTSVVDSLDVTIDELRARTGNRGNGPTGRSVAMGGGSGYDSIVTSSEADYVAETIGEVEHHIQGAAAGEIVYIPGDIVLDVGGHSLKIPQGVTLASDRGRHGSSGALLRTEESPQVLLRPKKDARVTGLRLRGPTPGETVTYQDGIEYETRTYAIRIEGADVEVDNCKIRGWPDRAVSVQQPVAHIHHNYILDNNGQGLGYGVASAAESIIEYNYFHNNRHSVTCANDAAGYTAQYNHFSPKSVMWPADIHAPFEGDTIVKSNIFENGESRTWDSNKVEGIAGYADGFNGGSLTVEDNWFFDEASAFDDSFDEVSSSGNVYGGKDSHNADDIIPGHPGFSERPWA